MHLYVLRHAEAEPAGSSDSARALTPKGIAQARTVGEFCARRAIRPALILTSPYRRTVQTAEIVGAALGMAGDPQAEAFLTSGMEAEAGLTELQAFGWAQSLLIVGHQPDLGQLVASLIGLSDPGALAVGKASLIGLRVERLTAYGAGLEFLLPSGLL